MKFFSTKITGAYRVEIERLVDERGFFSRTWCQRDFEKQNLESGLVQCSISYSPKRGTLRGMHYQQPPHEEVKLVRCTQGAIYDVILDLRSESPTRLAWEAFVLSAENRTSLYIPKGVAHGFLTLTDHCEVFYQMTEFFEASAARGARFNDPAFGIDWPEEVTMISDRDASYPLWNAN